MCVCVYGFHIHIHIRWFECCLLKLHVCVCLFVKNQFIRHYSFLSDKQAINWRKYKRFSLKPMQSINSNMKSAFRILTCHAKGRSECWRSAKARQFLYHLSFVSVLSKCWNFQKCYVQILQSFIHYSHYHHAFIFTSFIQHCRRHHQ